MDSKNPMCRRQGPWSPVRRGDEAERVSASPHLFPLFFFGFLSSDGMWQVLTVVGEHPVVCLPLDRSATRQTIPIGSRRSEQTHCAAAAHSHTHTFAQSHTSLSFSLCLPIMLLRIAVITALLALAAFGVLAREIAI